MPTLDDLIATLRAAARYELFQLGTSAVTVGGVLSLVALLVLLFKLTRQLQVWFVKRLTARGTDAGVGYAVGTITRYVVLVMGVVAILQVVGIDVSALLLMGSALGIGVGLGLQSITTNFVGGLVILIERPIKVGDRIEVGELNGNVVDISPRATTVLTNDNLAVIVPNSEFVSKQVINWSHPTRDVRFRVPVGVAYGTDPELVREVLSEVGKAHPGVLKEPAPDVQLKEFAESSMLFVLRVWTRDYTDRPGALNSDLNFAICKAFKARGIEIPFPQRVVHLGAPGRPT